MCKKCSVEGCENKHRCKGYCNKHYQQYLKYGYVLERSRKDLNEIIEYEDYAEVVLYDKNNKEVARTIIDLDDINKVKDIKWCFNCGGYAYSKRHGFLHRLIMDCPDDMVVDHWNHNRLDNRKENLRVCTHQENMFNTSMRVDNTSGTIGVFFEESKRKWTATIQVCGRKKHLGYYEYAEDAIEARKQAEILYFGEFSPSNAPDEPVI